MLNHNEVCVIGAGLAGCEAAYYLAQHGVYVKLYEMKSIKKTPAQSSENFAELVCSNSLKNEQLLSASGLLKNELNELDCFLLKCALKTRVPSGNALSVDREKFSKMVTDAIKSHPNIEIIDEVVEKFDVDKPTIIATGPLCDDKLYKYLSSLIGDNNCYFYDAIAPIINADSIDYSRAFWANRYDQGDSKDYLNCYMYKDEFDVFFNELINAKRVELHNFEKLKVFEGCMPIEILASRGEKALRYGPLKPVGLSKKVEGEKPYAIVQLRKENNSATCLNMVGFQTNLTYGEQKRVFSLIPALKNAEFIRYGSMHRNSYICSPKCLNEYSQLKKYPNIFIAGQISGVEGYVESIASGLYSAINMLLYIQGKKLQSLPNTTVIGALMHFISSADADNFQPMNSNYGIVECEQCDDKIQKKRKMLENSQLEIKRFKERVYGQ